LAVTYSQINRPETQEALENDAFVHLASAIVGCKTPSALAFKAAAGI
jgi:hypothetical protein